MALLNAHSSSFSSMALTGPAKLDEVTRLMGRLTVDLQSNIALPPPDERGSARIDLTSVDRDVILEQLKVLGRDPVNADPIFTKEGIEVLTRHAFDSPSQSTRHNALRCLANAMLLKAEMRQIFVDLGYESKACTELKNDNRDNEFLLSRIIFLTTYNTNISLEKLVDKDHLAEIICTNISRHAKQHTIEQRKNAQVNPMDSLAMIETLKLLFNVTSCCPARAFSFASAVPDILLILLRQPIQAKRPLDPPVAPLVNSLINIPFGSSKDGAAKLFPLSTPNLYIDRLLDILDKSISAYADEELDQVVSPLLTLIHQFYEVAPTDVQRHIREITLPSEEDRIQVLGKTDSFASRLLRLSTNPVTPTLRGITPSFLFAMSGKDARTFVENVGYGFASGFLLQHNIPMPENALDAVSMRGENGSASGSGTGMRTHGKSNAETLVNPITGQKLEFEPKVNGPEMTQAEKEREAERLFVLFERLKKTGVMSVQNPIETALQRGRLEELEDDADSD